MKNVSTKKGWITGTTQPHVEPLPIPLIKEKHYGKSDKDFVKLKIHRYPASSMSDLYEFKTSLCDNGKLEEFLLFVRNSNTDLATSVILEADAKFKYLHTLVCGEALRQFDLLSDDVESTETLNVDYIIRGLAQYNPIKILRQDRSSQCAVEWKDRAIWL